MSLKHAILGFLSFKSLTGYDLKKAFDQSVQHFWPANQSQIYRTLSGLAADKMVDQEIVEREERLDMKRYHITDEGRAELHRWLSTPLAEQSDRIPQLIQVYFGGLLSDEEIMGILAHEIRNAEARLAIYRQMLQEFGQELDGHEQARALFLSLTTLEFGLRSDQAALDWLLSLDERIRQQDYKIDIKD